MSQVNQELSPLIVRNESLFHNGIVSVAFFEPMNANGPAIKGVCVTRRSIRVGSWYFSQKAVTVQGGYGTCFCRHGTYFIAFWRDRGTSLIGAAKLSPVTKLVAGTGAVSRYNLSWSQKLVKVQKFNCEYWREVRVPRSAGIVLVAGAKAKTMTNNLPILSVLACVLFFLFSPRCHFFCFFWGFNK